jgi:peptide/nickel transport system permease protein
LIRFITRRVLRGVIALLLFQSALFAMVHSIPGDFASIAGAFGGPAARTFLRNQLGLDRPLWDQYLDWLSRLFEGDLGTSFIYWPSGVAEVLRSSAPQTLLLFLSAAILAYAVGIWLGKQVAWRRGGLFELGAVFGSVAAYTSFAPWLAFLMLNLFAWELRLLPCQHLINFNIWLGADVSINEVFLRLFTSVAAFWAAVLAGQALSGRIWQARHRQVVRIGLPLTVFVVGLLWWSNSGHGRLALDLAEHLVLPLGTVVLLSFGETMMTMRTTMLETMNEDHVVAARAKGLAEAVVRDRHVARVAMLPVLTRLLLSLPFVLVGSLVIERVFFWRAMGQVVFNAVEFQDLPLIVGVLTVVGVITLAAHILLDILHAALDPRIRDA